MKFETLRVDISALTQAQFYKKICGHTNMSRESDKFSLLYKKLHNLYMSPSTAKREKCESYEVWVYEREEKCMQNFREETSLKSHLEGPMRS
jgi:hypothetical protein